MSDDDDGNSRSIKPWNGQAVVAEMVTGPLPDDMSTVSIKTFKEQNNIFQEHAYMLQFLIEFVRQMKDFCVVMHLTQ